MTPRRASRPPDELVARARDAVLGEMAATLRELPAACKRLRRTPGFAAGAVAALAVGIGASTAVLALVHGILLAPLPFRDADRLVIIRHEMPGFDMPGERTPTIGGVYAQLAHYLEHSRSFDAIGGYATFEGVIVDNGRPDHVRMASATAGFFRALGVLPLAGRPLTDDDPAPDVGVRGASLLGHGLWLRRFGRDDGVPGRVVGAAGFDNEIVGVLPPLPAFPSSPVDFWISLPVSRLRDRPEWQLTLMLGRLAPGVTPEQARDEINRLIQELPDHVAAPQIRRVVVDGRLRATVTPLHAWLVRDVQRPLWLLLAAVGVVLAIACVNVTNLIMVRTEARRHEWAVRTALGASGRDLVRHAAADSVVLVALATTAGAALAFLGVEVLARQAAVSLPRLETIDLWRQVAGSSLMPAAACVVIFSLVAWLGSRRRRPGDLAEARHASGGRPAVRLRHALVAFQLAMAVVLLVSAGLIARSFVALTRVDLGYEDRGVLTFRVIFPFQEIRAAGEDGVGRAMRFYDGLAERVGALPGVEAVGYGSCVPLSEHCSPAGFSPRRADQPDAGGGLPVALGVTSSPGYLRALGIPLLKGRYLEPRDHEQRTHAVVISAEAARRFFPDEDPLGRQLVQDGTTWTPFTVVGVVGDAQHEDPRKPPIPFVYLPLLGDFAPTGPWAVSFLVRTGGSTAGLVDQVRREVAALRPDIPLAHAATLSSSVARSTARLAFALRLLGLSAAAAVALSAIGAYGVMAYVVALRRREFGIRLALGAHGREVRAMVMRQGAAVTVAGLAGGLAASMLTAGLLRSLLFEIGPVDPATYAAVAIGLSAIALAAAYVPAARAARLDPARVLRSE